MRNPRANSSKLITLQTYATAGYLVSCDLREQDWRIHFGRNIQILPKQDWKWVQSKTVSAWAGPGPGKFWKFLIKFSWQNIRSTKAELLQLIRTQFLLVKQLEIEKTKTSFIISVLKVVYWVVLVFSIFNLVINKNSKGRKLSNKKFLLSVIQL